MDEMILESSGSYWKSFVNPANGKRVTLCEAQNNRNFKTYWTVYAGQDGTKLEMVASRCTPGQAMGIAREHYFK